jgi:hypothetical protein
MTDDRLLGHNESHYPRFRNDRAVSEIQSGRGSSNASAYRRRTITRMSISTWANGTRSATPTARRGSASIHDWDRNSVRHVAGEGVADERLALIGPTAK